MDMKHDHSSTATKESTMNMQMSFYWGKSATLLLDGWRTTSVGNYIGSLLAFLVIAFLYQYLEWLTSSASPLLCCPASAGSLKQAESSGSYGERLSVSRKLVLTALFGVRVGLAYLLMLAVMSFNGGVFLAVVLGFSAGFFVFRTDIHAPPAGRSVSPAQYAADHP